MKKVISILFLISSSWVQSAFIESTPIENLTDSDSPFFYIGQQQEIITFKTAQSLVSNDTNSDIDGYQFNLASQEISLLLPVSQGQTITLDDRISFQPVDVSANGNRVLLRGNSSFLRTESNEEALVVYDFEEQSYYSASILDDGTTAPYPENYFISKNGQYVFFSNRRFNNSRWELKFYRRNLDTQETTVVLEGIDQSNDGFIDSSKIGFIRFSANGNRFLTIAADQTIDANDTDGESDRFLVDITNNQIEKLSFITSDGNSLTNFSQYLPSPSFSHVLLRADGSTSAIGDYEINEKYAVYDVSTRTTTGLSEYLNIPAKYINSTSGSSYATWGNSERYLIFDTVTSFLLPGDYMRGEAGLHIFDTEQQQAWILGLNEDGISHFEDSFKVVQRLGNVAYPALLTEGTNSQYSVLISTVESSDVSINSVAQDSVATITISNPTQNNIENIGIKFTFPFNTLTSDIITQQFDDCLFQTVNDILARLDCRVGTIAANANWETSFDFTDDFINATESDSATLDVYAASLSDPDIDLSNNTSSVQLKKATTTPTVPDAPTSSSSGGGAFALSILLLLLLCRRVISKNSQ